LGAHTATSGSDTIKVGTIGTAAILPSVIITGAAAGDIVGFSDVVSSTVTLTTSQLSTANSQASLSAAITYVDALASTVAHSETAFQWSGNTYLIESAATGTGTLTSNDGFVELAGLTSAAGIAEVRGAWLCSTLPARSRTPAESEHPDCPND
jgi:hypothetical protein